MVMVIKIVEVTPYCAKYLGLAIRYAQYCQLQKFKVYSITWLTMRLLVLLSLLLSLQSYAYAEGISNCEEGNKRVRVTEGGNHYRLQLCTSRDSCTGERNFIKIDDERRLCEYCRTIPGIEDQGNYDYSVIIQLKRYSLSCRLQ